MSAVRLRLRGPAAAVLLLCPLLAAAADIDATFTVLLDDVPIGEHRFVVTGPAEARKVVSEARFAVKLLGLTVYRYRHQASEQWRGNCLSALDATTDDDGTPSRVTATATAEGLSVMTGGNAQALDGCVMSFAYWNPAMRQQAQLLNAQTGRHEAVRIARMGGGNIPVRGQPVAAVRWRIDGPAQPVDVWYGPQGEWIGLDSTVSGGRKLSYRLR